MRKNKQKKVLIILTIIVFAFISFSLIANAGTTSLSEGTIGMSANVIQAPHMKTRTTSNGICGMKVYIEYIIWTNWSDWWQMEYIGNPPTFGTPSPTNGSTTHDLSLTWNITINDNESDAFDWTIQCSNGQSSNANGASNGTKSLSLSDLAIATTYAVWVNATDGHGWTREWYTFTVLADVYVDDNAAPGWYDATHVATIQEGVNNVSSGQSIYVYNGTYPETLSGPSLAYITITDKNITIIGERADNPKICPEMSNSSRQYIFYFPGSGYSLTLQYLDISNEMGGATTPVHMGIYVPAQNNLTVDHCILHDINQGIKCYGNVTFTNNTVYHFKYRALEGSWSAATYALQFICKYNIIYDAVVNEIHNEAIKAKYGHWYGDISYNYIAGCRVGIWVDEEGKGPLCKFGGNWTVSHNTIVSKYDPSNLDDIEQSISFTSLSDNFSKIDCRDNLISGCGYYAVHLGRYSTGYPYSDNMTIQNCLFNDYYTYWNDTNFSLIQPQLWWQWNGTGYSENITYGPNDPHTIGGWPYNTSAPPLLNFKNCIVADPLFVGVGAPENYWGLRLGSPAVNNATDGTNIGAWQGTPSETLLFLGNPNPANSSSGHPLSLTWQIMIDPDDIFDWTIECSNGQSSSGTSELCGIKSLNLTNLSYLTTYTVWVNATDGYSWIRGKYTFTTGLTPTYPGYFTQSVNYLLLHPESDIVTEWTVSGAVNHYEAVLNNDSKYIYSASGSLDRFGLTDHTTETGQILNVIICSNVRASSIDYPYWGISDGTNNWWSNGTTAITTSYAWYNTSIGSTVPWSGQDWTWTDLDNLVANIHSSGEKTIYCDQLYLIVEYSPYIISDETFINGTAYAHVYNSYLTAFVSNQNLADMNVSFYWINGTLVHTINDVESGTIANLSLYLYHHPHSWLTHDTTYYWYIIVENVTQSNSPVWIFHTSKAWDCDENEDVNYLDVSIVVSNYDASGYLPGEIPADIIEDGAVNYLDVSSLVSHYGESY